MRTSLSRTLWMFGLAGTCALVMASAAVAAGNDNDRWNQGQAELQKNLSPGSPSDAYQKKLEELGYKVTSTNYNDPNYLEYEVVKGDQTWEVQINVDNNTHRATKVDIVSNTWKTDATEQALKNPQATASRTESAPATSQRSGALRNNQYSERDRSTTEQLVKELETLPVGRDKQFYKDTLQKQGFEISRVDKDDADKLELEAVKNGRSVKMDVNFDEKTAKSTEVNASSLWAESEATTKTREHQEKKGSPTASMEHKQDQERHSQRDTSASR